MEKVRKRILSGVLVGIFVLLPGFNCKVNLKSKARAEEISIEGTEDKVVSMKNISMYNRDDFKTSIGKIKMNTELFRIFESYYFDVVNYNNKLGFIPKYNIQDSGIKNVNIKYDEVKKIGKTTSAVNLRLGPSIDYESLGVINEGEIIDILFSSSNSWNLVDYNGTLGFVSSDYCKMIDFCKLEKELNELPKIIKKVVAIENVNIREMPSINSNKLGILKKNNKLTIVKILNNGWIEVTNAEDIGYVKQDYVMIVDAIAGKYYKNIYMKHDTKIYNYPYEKQINELPKYETAFVYGETEDFYLIESEKIAGYVKKSDTKELNNTYAVIDISSQKIKIYKGIKELLSSSIVTGKKETPTDLGYFKISQKESDYLLETEDYSVIVDYWLRYNHGEGIHDASWKSKFGKNYYLENGSHGCVNVPSAKMKEVYDNLAIGDKVLVKR